MFGGKEIFLADTALGFVHDGGMSPEAVKLLCAESIETRQQLQSCLDGLDQDFTEGENRRREWLVGQLGKESINKEIFSTYVTLKVAVNYRQGLLPGYLATGNRAVSRRSAHGRHSSPNTGMHAI